jgi:hypothetical protein
VVVVVLCGVSTSEVNTKMGIDNCVDDIDEKCRNEPLIVVPGTHINDAS